MRLSATVKLVGGLAVLIAVFIGNALTYHQATSRLEKDEAWVAHTHEVLLHIEALRYAMKDAESGQRGYLITGQREYLKPYFDARHQSEAELRSLEHLTTDNPRQLKRIATTSSLIEQRFAMLDDVIRLHDNSGRHQAALAVSTGAGKRLMDDLLAQVSEMEAEEQALLVGRSQVSAQSRTSANRALWLATAVGIALLILVFWLIHRQVASLIREKRSLRELELTRARMEGIVSSAMDAIISVNEQHRIVIFNQAAESIFRCTRAEALGQPLDRFIPEKLRRIHNEHIQSFASSGTTTRSMDSPGVLAALRATGEEFPIEATISQVRTGQEKLFTVILRDISERRRTAEALQVNEERLALVVEAAKIGTWEWDIITGELKWSDRCMALFGLKPGSPVTYEIFLQAVDPEDRERVDQAVRDALERRRSYNTVMRTRWPDGSLHWISSRGRAYYDTAGNPLRMSGAAFDITELKKSEEALIRNERLAATGRLAATIAHEIKNPLEGMTGLLYLLNEKVTDANGREYLQLIDAEVKSIVRIANQTLNLHRDSAKEERFSLKELIRELTEFYSPKARKQGVELIKLLEAEGSITGYIGEIRQVISNLLVNAIEATPRGGKVTVHLREPACHNGSRGYSISILDTGCGIPREFRSQIFDPFFTTKGEGGTGLGLWVTAGIIARAGGRIRVWSSCRDQRSGSCFSVFLPALKADVKHAVEPAISA